MVQRRSAIGVAAFVDSVHDQQESEHEQCARNQGMDEVDRVSHPVIQIRRNLRLSSHEEESASLPQRDLSRGVVHHRRCPKGPEYLIPSPDAVNGTGGRRRRLRAFPSSLTHVCKESNQLEEVEAESASARRRPFAPRRPDLEDLQAVDRSASRGTPGIEAANLILRERRRTCITDVASYQFMKNQCALSLDD